MANAMLDARQEVRRLGDGNRSFLCRAEDDRRTRIAHRRNRSASPTGQ